MQDFSNLPTANIVRETSTSPEKIWAVLSDLTALAEWAPGIDGAEVRSLDQPGVGTVREVTTAQFGVIVHEVTVWEEGRALAYKTADSGPFSRTLTTYEIKDGEISVSLAFEVKPQAISEEEAIEVLSKGLTATLKALDERARMGGVLA